MNTEEAMETIYQTVFLFGKYLKRTCNLKTIVQKKKNNTLKHSPAADLRDFHGILDRTVVTSLDSCNLSDGKLVKMTLMVSKTQHYKFNAS